jgi:chromosome segregation ATPase
LIRCRLQGLKICRHSERERAATAEKSALQAEIQTLCTEAAAKKLQVQELETRASHGEAAIAEAKTLREEAAAAATTLAETERKLRESEHALQSARDELEMAQDRVCLPLLHGVYSIVQMHLAEDTSSCELTCS